MKWFKKLDDLDLGDLIDVDCGDSKAVGRYTGLHRQGSEWSILIKRHRKNVITAIPTKQIQDIQVARDNPI
jgi:hypothetical protein